MLILSENQREYKSNRNKSVKNNINNAMDNTYNLTKNETSRKSPFKKELFSEDIKINNSSEILENSQSIEKNMFSRGPILNRLEELYISKNFKNFNSETAQNKLTDSRNVTVMLKNDIIRKKENSSMIKKCVSDVKTVEIPKKKKSFEEDKSRSNVVTNILSKAENITKLKIDGSLSNIKDNLKSFQRIDEYIEKIKKEINELKPIKYIKSVNKISAFAASSFQNSKKINEDKIKISLNIKSNINYKNQIHYFAVFDGHYGSACSEFLRDNLHTIIVNQNDFISCPDESIIKGFQKAQEIFFKQALEAFKISKDIDKSGSCANLCFMIEDILYLVNLGDSRSILSNRKMNEIYQLTKDHKPTDTAEKDRILISEGNIYRNCSELYKDVEKFMINPGGLAVSRSFGDIAAKMPEFGGKHNVILNTPDIIGFKLDYNSDFLIIGTDGIYNKLKNKDIVINVVESCLEAIENNYDKKKFIGISIQNLFKLCVEKDSKKNLSCIILYFDNFMDLFKNKNTLELEKRLNQLRNSNIKDDNSLEHNLICKRELFSNKNIIDEQKYNKKKLKLSCCDFFFKKK